MATALPLVHQGARGPAPTRAEGLAQFPDRPVMGLGHRQLGIPSQEEYVQAYCRGAGRSDRLLPFHVAFSLFRFAVIIEGIAGRAQQGNAAAANAEEVGALSVALAAQAVAVAGLT